MATLDDAGRQRILGGELAQRLVEGEQIVVSRRGGGSTSRRAGRVSDG
jgi:hypothetical protein